MSNTLKIPFEVGDRVSTSKTISESDIYLFAGVSGDMNPVHVNEQYMSQTDLKHRIAHGLLVFSIASGTECTLLSYHPHASKMEDCGITYLSYGYDKVRFLKPVFIGDTVTSTYEVAEIDDEIMRSLGKMTVVNQNGDLVFVATHILKFFPKEK